MKVTLEGYQKSGRYLEFGIYDGSDVRNAILDGLRLYQLLEVVMGGRSENNAYNLDLREAALNVIKGEHDDIFDDDDEKFILHFYMKQLLDFLRAISLNRAGSEIDTKAMQDAWENDKGNSLKNNANELTVAFWDAFVMKKLISDWD